MMMTLRELYEDDFPDKDELFWEFILKGDLDTPFPVESINPLKWAHRRIKGQAASLMEIFEDHADWDQKRIVTAYRKDIKKGIDIGLPVITSDLVVVDGNHRIISMALEKKTKMKVLKIP